jgi:sirohydrochlorin cobaltochelatase
MSTQALVLVGHGSHLNPDSAAPVFDHADAIRESGAFDEVRESFWKEEPSLREVLRTVESDAAYVVPLFTSEGYFTQRVVPRELRLGEGRDLDVDIPVRYADPVGTHDAMTDVIVARAESVTGDPGVGPGVGLAIVGHGTERHEGSGNSTRYHAGRVRERDRFAEVRALFMDEEPDVADALGHLDSEDVVVVPLFVADGYHTREDIPEDLGLTDDHRTGWEVPTRVGGRRVWYAGAVGTEPALAEVVLERAVEAGADVGAARERLRTRLWRAGGETV